MFRTPELVPEVRRADASVIAFLATVLWVFAAVPTAAQTAGIVEGTVIEAMSERPLPSVLVTVEGTRLTALTNARGEYRIVGIPAGQHSVQARLVGYRMERVSVSVQAGQTHSANFQLSQAAIALDQIVVTGAGVATERRKLGNTIASIDMGELQNLPIPDFSALIGGREPGVVGLPSSGTTGEGARIRIRGSASLSQSNEPIIYVDGIRVDRSGGFGPGVGSGGQGMPSRLDDIDPGSIERIEILKGAAAATLFGTEASNGVIQIFTKRGQQGAPRWTFQMDQSLISVPQGRMIPLADFARTADDQARIQARWGRQVGLFEPFQENVFPDFFTSGYQQTYSGNVSGGGDLITYFVSGRYQWEDGPFDQKGLDVPAIDKNVKRQASANVNIFPFDPLRIRISGFYSEVNHETPANSNNIFGVFSSALMSQLRLAREGNLYGQPAFATAVENAQRRTFQDSEHFAGSLNANWTIREGLTFDGTFGLDLTNGRAVTFFPFGWNVDGFSPFFTEGSRSINDRNHREVTADFKLHWDAEFGADWNSTFLVGTQGFLNQTVSSGGFGDNFPGPGLEVVGAAADQSVFEQFLRVVNVGVFFQEQIGWRDWAFLTAGGRLDANSAFGEDFDAAFYPKASLSVMPSQRGAWNEPLGISTLRFRTAIGQSGLQPGAFDKFTTFSPLPSSEGPGLAPANLGNQELKPEVATEWELGAEIGVANDRVALEFTYWNRTVNDALVNRQFPVTGGFRSSQLDNIGEIEARGFEIGLSGEVFSTPSYRLTAFINGAYLHQEVTDMGGAPPLKTGGAYPRYRNFIKEGYAPGAFFGAEVDRSLAIPLNLNGNCVEPTSAEALAFFSQPRDPGSFEVIELGCVPGGSPFLDTFLGKPEPDWQGSMGFNLSFLQNFELNSVFEYKWRNFHVQDLSGAFRQANSVIGRNTPLAAQVEATLLNPASTPEQRMDAAITWAQELRALAPMSGMNQIWPADFLRWRELSLSYRIPGERIAGWGLQSATVSLAARNLALWVNSEYRGIDPEVNILGRCEGGLDCNFLNSTEGWGIPIPRTFTLSVRVGF